MATPGGLGLGSALSPLGVSGISSFAGGTIKDVVLSETVGVLDTPTVNVKYGVTSPNGVGVTYRLLSTRAQPATLTQGVGVSSVLVLQRGLAYTEEFALAPALLPNHKFQKTSSETTALATTLTPGVPVTLSQTVGVALTQQVEQALILAETLGLGPVLTPAARYGQTAVEAFAIKPELLRFLGADLTQGVGLTQTQAAQVLRLVTLSQTVGITPTRAAQLLLRVTTAEDIAIDASEVLQMIYSPVLTQGIEIAAAYLSPDGGFTSWAMNTRTAAVTEYSNYQFNSFAVLDGKSVGATSTGLYELIGDTDAGAAIITEIKSGFMQFGGTKLSRLKAAYIATRGDATFVLRIETGLGEIYNYAVSTRNMRSTKVHMGKGQRARYFSFELISTGADFDIDTLEFVPIVVDRRV